ncbi:MAG: LutB/LldF family L-lactate oxidation iron-sulfur protein [Phycisphaerae bacterium]
MPSVEQVDVSPPARDFRSAAAVHLRDEAVLRAVHLATLRKVDQRAAGLAQLRDAEALRDLAARIKQHALEYLPRYLSRFAENVERRGGFVHIAPDADAACEIIRRIAMENGLKLAVKAKSMTSEEVRLNAALERAGVRTVETDLGEFIVQIDRDRPSHIVTPIIHKDRRQIAVAMSRELGCAHTEDPAALTAIARRHLREIFRRCDLGITGVNFGIAETGSLCICTNEGNGRMTLTRPRVHVALMGIEKLIPRMRDLPVFLKLLARSSTGQPLTVYTSIVSGPRRAADADGPRQLHVVLLDAGRSEILCGDSPELLRCIRCGACLNACPVYRNVGGHAYGGVYPGPIGAAITPLLDGAPRHAELPRASSLCGACQQSCPVKIDIPAALMRLRERARDAQPLKKRFGMRFFAWMMSSARRYRLAQAAILARGRAGGGWIRGGWGTLAAWTEFRDLPVPRKTFRQLWDERLRDELEGDDAEHS